MTTTATFRYGSPEAPTRYHAYEGDLPVPLETQIVGLAPKLWVRFQEFGYTAGLDCTRVAPVWLAALRQVGLPALLLEGGGRGAPGGYLFDSPTRPDAHEWLAVGVGLWLFDPTWWQFRRLGPARLERYSISRGDSFAAWRQLQLNRSSR